MNVWKCKLIFPSDTLQQNLEITALKHFLAAENTSVLRHIYVNDHNNYAVIYLYFFELL